MQSKNLSIVLAAVLGLSTVGFVGCGGGSDSPTVAPAGVFGFQSASYNTTVAEGSTGTIIDVSTVNPTESSVTYALTGAHMADFTIDTNGRVTYIGSNSLSVGSSPYTFTVTASAAGETDITQVVTITVTASSVSAERIVVRTGQDTSYDRLGNTVGNGSLKDDGYYSGSKGVQRGYEELSGTGGTVIRDIATGLEWEDTVLTLQTRARAWEICDTKTAAGGNWRLPTIGELQTLVDYNKYNNNGINSALIDRTFDNKRSGIARFWTNSENAYTSADDYWYLDFERGTSYYTATTGTNLYRCVRGNEGIYDTNDFEKNGDIVTDSSTNLMWADDNSALYSKIWENAISTCERLGLGGYNDWRLPNKNELSTLINMSGAVKIDRSIFTKINLGELWSSTTVRNGTNNEAWTINFTEGTDHTFNKSRGVFNYCVRDAN